MKINKLPLIVLCGMLLSIFMIAGCAGPYLYSINMYYDAYQADIPAHIKNSDKNADFSISVAEFSDIRKIDDDLVIGRVIESNSVNVLIVPKNMKATKAISTGIKQYLKEAGYKVSENMEPWNLKEESIPKGDSQILVGGNIEELEIYCRKDLLTNAYTSSIKLNIVFADMTKGRILYNTTVESAYSTEHVLFSENILAEQLDIVLADAIEKLFDDRKVAQKLKEVMTSSN